jgi:hypothetical protein
MSIGTPLASKDTSAFWQTHREAALNWLALGLLLAAWNGVDNSAPTRAQRPATLRGYEVVSVRALQRDGH